MSLSNLLKSKKQSLIFEELPGILDISPGYARKVVSDLVDRKIFLTEKDKSDKRKTIYLLNWPALRGYLLTIPNDYDEIILSIVTQKYTGTYVAIDNFEVLHQADDLTALTRKVGYIKSTDNILITHVGDPIHKLVLETE